ncbi:hypothetical protein [Cytobacillus firmus]|uniref:hypothetical protein n=1 Tax=Cytobacillus firmus TaxID=1399 RepID=UPI001F50CFDF|nr:hypothetical protein [Cytobacillus firmus]
MPLGHTKNMLETLKYYSDSQITQTFTKDQSQILVVSYIKESHSLRLLIRELHRKGRILPLILPRLRLNRQSAVIDSSHVSHIKKTQPVLSIPYQYCAHSLSIKRLIDFFLSIYLASST